MKSEITVDTSGNYPVILGAGLIGDIANKRISDYWVRSGSGSFPPVDQILLDILIEDYNERHAPEAFNPVKAVLQIDNTDEMGTE